MYDLDNLDLKPILAGVDEPPPQIFKFFCGFSITFDKYPVSAYVHAYYEYYTMRKKNIFTLVRQQHSTQPQI